jgi:hypothetical protein
VTVTAKMHMLRDNRGEFDMLLIMFASGCLSVAFLCYPAAFDSASGFAAWGPPLTKETNDYVSRPSQPYRLRHRVSCAAHKSQLNRLRLFAIHLETEHA